jgi:hypothetical protein
VTVRYRGDYDGLGELMRSGEMQQAMRQVAEDAMEYAASTAPVRTGDYKAHFSVTVTGEGGKHGNRAEADVVNDSDHAVLVEWTDGYRTLQNAAERLALLE